MKKEVFAIPFKEREKEFFLAMKNFLSQPASKYERLVYTHIWITCFYFLVCNDPLRTFATCLQVSTLNVSLALKSLEEKDLITSKPYMIK